VTRADGVVIALAAALVGGLFAKFWQPPVAAAEAEVHNGAQVVGHYPLTETRRIEVAGRQGISVIEIRDGGARFVSSPCRNKVCVHAGWQSHSGDFAACVPNGVSVSLLGGAAGKFDSVSY
jgi:hypothetical protein